MDLMDITTLPDTQSHRDQRGLAVDGAGVRALRLPAHVVDVDGQACATVATSSWATSTRRDMCVPRWCAGTPTPRSNPKFAEDLVRDLYAHLDARTGAGVWSVETENEESIHNHLAYARITRAGMD